MSEELFELFVSFRTGGEGVKSICISRSAHEGASPVRVLLSVDVLVVVDVVV